MRKSFKAGLPTTGALSEPKVIVRVILGTLLVANLIAAGFAFHVFDESPDALNAELVAAMNSRRIEEKQLVHSRVLASNIDKGKADGEHFLASYMTSRRVTYSTVLGELTETAKNAGMQKTAATIALDPIEGSEDLDMMSISVNLEGTYAQLMKFVNLLDRSPRFLLIEQLTVTPRAKSDILSVNVKLDTFVKDDKDGRS
jgi:type IV pilus assembly protein PilO